MRNKYCLKIFFYFNLFSFTSFYINLFSFPSVKCMYMITADGARDDNLHDFFRNDEIITGDSLSCHWRLLLLNAWVGSAWILYSDQIWVGLLIRSCRSHYFKVWRTIFLNSSCYPTLAPIRFGSFGPSLFRCLAGL